jgi:hypothetical protein
VPEPVAYLPASGRLPWLAFFMRSFFSLRRRVLAIESPLYRLYSAARSAVSQNIERRA